MKNATVLAALAHVLNCTFVWRCFAVLYGAWRPALAVWNAHHKERAAVTENGKTRRLPVLEVMVRRLANDVMRSDPKALKLLLWLMERHTESETEPRLEELHAENPAGYFWDGPQQGGDE
jgi:hypothetical protein